jgi:hypothetical protein
LRIDGAVSTDFHLEPSNEDLTAFVANEFQFLQSEYDGLMKRLFDSQYEILLKQLRSARVKFDQILVGRSTFQTNINKMFEKNGLFNLDRLA